MIRLLRGSIEHLFFLSLTQALFLWITTPSPTIKPALYGVFSLAAIASLLFSHVSLNRVTSLYQTVVSRFISLIIFGVIWSLGIVQVTRFLSDKIATQSGAEAVLFYSTSGTQFLSYQDISFCWFLLTPIAICYLICTSFMKGC